MADDVVTSPTPSAAAPSPTPTPSASTSSASVAQPSTPAASAAPKSALEAFEKHAAAADPQAPSPSPAESGRPTLPTSTAIGVPAPAGPTTPQGPIPFERHQAAIENARDKVREEYKWAQEYGGKTEIDQAVQRWRWLNANPQEFLNRLAQETGYKVVPLNPPPDTPQEAIDPTDDLRADDGTTTLSGKGIRTLIRNMMERQEAKLAEQMKPALDYTKSAQEEVQRAEIRAQAKDFAVRSFTEVSKLPHFDREGVNKEYLSLSPDQRTEMGAHGALMTAYTNYLVKNVLPTLGQRQEAQVIEDLRRSAVAGSTTAATATPSASSSKPKLKDGDVNGLARLMEQRWGESLATS